MTNLAVVPICNSRESAICSVKIKEKGMLDSAPARTPESLLTEGGENLLLKLDKEYVLRQIGDDYIRKHEAKGSLLFLWVESIGLVAYNYSSYLYSE